MFYDVAVGANAAYDQIITFAKLMEKNIHVNEPEFKIEYNILFFSGDFITNNQNATIVNIFIINL